ncbi:MAG: PIN domain-containing protein [Candidatus Aenigmarchaeota archaeon]|nr:PIN domain-containing protein [Candidatus Aenigmarchaeota archaeon]
MRILADTNRIIAALVKAGTTRNILFDENFEFVTPDYTITEIRQHEDELLKKTKLTKEEFELLLALIFEHVTIIPLSEYEDFIDQCKNDISDPDDIPHLAACLASNAYGIWAHDQHFLEQRKAKVLTNIDMLRLSGKAKSD